MQANLLGMTAGGPAGSRRYEIPRAATNRRALGYKRDAQPTGRDEAASGFRGYDMSLKPTFKKRRWGTRKSRSLVVVDARTLLMDFLAARKLVMDCLIARKLLM